MAEGTLGQHGLLATLFHDHVAGGICSLGHALMGYVGDGAKEGGELFLCLVHDFLKFLVA